MEAQLQLSQPSNPSNLALDGDATSNFNLIQKPETKAKQTKGRRKVPIEKIENKTKKHVTFSKRRTGLFRKASELCILCGASVAVVTFSEAGKVFSFGHPSPDAVIHRYVNGSVASSSQPSNAIAGPSGSKYENNVVGVGNGDLLLESNPIEDQRTFWWDRPIEELGFDELVEFAGSLEQFRCNVEGRISYLDLERSKAPVVPMKNEIVEHPMFQGGMEGNYFAPPGFISLPPPGNDGVQFHHQQQNQNLYQYGRRFMGNDNDDGIGSRVAMPEYNSRFGRGVFGDY